MTLANDFECLRSQCYHLLKNRPEMDGQAFWGLLKKILGECDNTRFPWKSCDPNLFSDYMSLPEYYVDGYGNKVMDKSNHFKIQTVRLTTETPNLRKLFQVALNLGFYEASVRNCQALYHLQITNYISASELEDLEQKIPVDVMRRYFRVLADYINDQGLEMI